MVLGSTVWRSLSIGMADSEGSECNYHQCVYATPTRLTRASLPVVNHPCIYAGDFNCHHTEWGYSRSNNDRTCLVEWASANSLTLVYNPKEHDSFHSTRWNSGTNQGWHSCTSARHRPFVFFSGCTSFNLSLPLRVHLDAHVFTME